MTGHPLAGANTHPPELVEAVEAAIDARLTASDVIVYRGLDDVARAALDVVRFYDAEHQVDALRRVLPALDGAVSRTATALEAEAGVALTSQTCEQLARVAVATVLAWAVELDTRLMAIAEPLPPDSYEVVPVDPPRGVSPVAHAEQQATADAHLLGRLRSALDRFDPPPPVLAAPARSNHYAGPVCGVILRSTCPHPLGHPGPCDIPEADE